MSDDEPEPETVETSEETPSEEEELPDIDSEDMADFEEVAQQAAESPNDGDDESSDDQQEEGAGDQQNAPSIDFGSGDEPTPKGTGSWGDLYVEGLTVGLNQLIEARGKAGAEQIEESLPRQIGLDDAFDEMMAKRGKSELPPEQHVLYGSLGLAIIVIVSKTDVPSELADNLDSMEAAA